MIYKNLGKSNLRVSALCLGTMMFADQTAKTDASNIVASAKERGVNFIDTADVYSKGASEIMVGELLAGQRDQWVLATKIGNKMSEEVNEHHYSRSWMHRELDQSLKRLQTDYVDIYYLHRDFDDMNLEECLHTLADFIRAGKIRYWGISNFRGWRIAEVIRVAGLIGMPGPVVCQPYYNLLNRMPEVEILPACQYYGIGVVPYSPIARGVLTGKYQPGVTAPENTRAGRADKRIMETEFRSESLAIAQQLQAYVANHGVSLAQFATAWVAANPIVSSVIAGPRTLQQWEDYFPALDYTVTSEDEVLVNTLVQPGHPSTPGYNDPAYPFYGRPVR